MPINETISGDSFSAEINPTTATSDAAVGPHNGRVVLQTKVPGGDWTTVNVGAGSYCVATPDLALVYRFAAVGVTAPGAHVYFGG